jgi:chemotaxis protein CheD
MAHIFCSSGVRKADIEARVFGGAELFALPSLLRSPFAVGPRNIEAAKSTLTWNGIKVSSQIVGGCTGRRIDFNTMSGAVSVQRFDTAVRPIGGD